MAEEISIPKGDKRAVYEAILPQIAALVEGERNAIANISNVMAVLHGAFDHLWTGCYFVDGDTLVLGPFQGPVACTRIGQGMGVCGKAREEKRTLIVPDVEKFPGHIACSSRSKSEIVVPVVADAGKVLGVLDIDSENLNTFDETDALYLEKVAEILKPFFDSTR